MKYLKIQNDGVLDIRLVALMGGTTKSKDEYKIGQFGTGLKYTLAFLYRNNLDFKIFCGNEEVKLHTEKEVIRGEEFEIICINGQRTSITTRMGHEWAAWMIIRELWCNALDEGGADREVVHDTQLSGKEDTTTFFIQINADLQQVLDNWTDYFVNQQWLLWENDRYRIYQKREKAPLRIYKNGVLVFQHPQDTPSLFDYDIKRAQINELREFRGVLSYEVFGALENPSQDVVSYFLHNITKDHYEGSELQYDWFTSFASVWRDALGDKRVCKDGDREYYSENGVHVDFSNVLKLPKKVYDAIVKEFEGVGVMVMSDDKTEFFEVAGTTVEDKINDCLRELEMYGYNLSEGVTITYGMFRDKYKKSAASRKNKKIMISEVCKSLAADELIAMLIEENEYLGLECEKSSVEFTRHFVRLFAKKTLTQEPELA